jgi:hypothetical protein
MLSTQSGPYAPNQLQGGEADHMLHLATRLSERGLDVNVLTAKGSEASNKFLIKVFPVMRDWSWSDLPRLIKFIMRCRPHGILLKYSGWLYSDHPMITFAPTLAKFLLPNCQFITQFGFADGSHPEWKSPLVRKVLAAITLAAGKKDVDYQFGTLLRNSDSLIALGDLYGAMLAKRLPAAQRKTMVIPPRAILYMIEEKGLVVFA